MDAMRTLFATVLTCIVMVGCESEIPIDASPVPGWDTDFAQEMCTTDPCRGPLEVKLRLADGSAFELRLTRGTPIVQKGQIVTIFPGETVLLSATIEGDRLTQVRPTDSDAIPALQMQLSQAETGPPTMQLNVRSTFPRAVKFDLDMMLPGADNGATIYTSSCPVIAGTTNAETWPEPIFQLIATNFRLVDASSPDEGCE